VLLTPATKEVTFPHCEQLVDEPEQLVHWEAQGEHNLLFESVLFAKKPFGHF
jgi:hypothetical protein